MIVFLIVNGSGFELLDMVIVIKVYVKLVTFIMINF